MAVAFASAFDGMRLIITDVSVLFDLFYLEVLSELFDLDYDICVTAFVYNEIVHQEQILVFEQFKHAGKLIVLEVLAEELEAILAFKTIRSLRSVPDKTILWKAIQLQCPVLTCDEKLRKEALDHGIEVHGSIWVLSEMNRLGLQSNKKTIKLLEALKTINSRLPFKTIDAFIHDLQSM